MYSGITSGRVLNGELLYTKILEVNLFAFANKLTSRIFVCIYIYIYIISEEMSYIMTNCQPNRLAIYIYIFKILSHQYAIHHASKTDSKWNVVYIIK